MTTTEAAAARRLDSWKAISAYLARDERTVRRWEKELGLPIRRVPGRRGGSVFAYVGEIEAWLRTVPPIQAPAPKTGDTPALSIIAGSLPAGPSAPAPETARLWARVATIAATATLVLGANGWSQLPRPAGGTARYDMTPAAVVATDEAGAVRWRFVFPPGEQAGFSAETPWAAAGPGRSGLYALVTHRTRKPDDAHLGGQLLQIDADGRAGSSWSLDDRLSFGAGTYAAPWDLMAFRIDDRGAGRRVAIAAHHDVWWPGVVTVLDDRWRRRGTFVNAGWIENVQWMSPTRLLISGMSNAHDGGMVALLDADALDGQSPEAPGSPFRCLTCASAPPLRYLIFPRSELNRVTASEFNRARLSMSDEGVTVRTEEAVQDGGATIFDALYEFSPSLDLIHASYSDRYWDLHKALEAEGKIRHTRAQCPDRNGPTEIEMWEPSTGWRTIKIHD